MIWVVAGLVVFFAAGVLFAVSLAMAAHRADERMKAWSDEPLRRPNEPEHRGGWRI
jgi:hypothetical protein